MSERRRITVSFIGELATVRFNDKKIVDSKHIEELGEELSSLVDKDRMKHVLLNFDGVDFLASATLNKLLMLDKKVKQVEGKLQLCNLRSELLEVFTSTGLNRVFDIRQFSRDDDDPEEWGAWVPKPTPPDNLDGHTEPPSG